MISSKFYNIHLKHTNTKKVREKSRECHNHTAAPPRHQEEEETDKTKTSANRTNVRNALRLALSSLSEVITMLKGLKTQEQNNTR